MVGFFNLPTELRLQVYANGIICDHDILDAANMISLRNTHKQTEWEVSEMLRRTELRHIRMQDEQEVAFIADVPSLPSRITFIDFLISADTAQATTTRIPGILRALAADFPNIKQLDFVVHDQGSCGYSDVRGYRDYNNIRHGIRVAGDVIDTMTHLKSIQIRDLKLEWTTSEDGAFERERHERRNRGEILFELRFGDRVLGRKYLKFANACLQFWLSCHDRKSQVYRTYLARMIRQPR